MMDTGIDSSRYLELRRFAEGIISAASAAVARICQGRRTIESGNSFLQLFGTGGGPNICRRMSGSDNPWMKGEIV
jgi:hypothetical protein